MKVVSEIELYEVDDKLLEIGKGQSMKVESHWNRNEMVILSFMVGNKCVRLTVSKCRLQAAMENACNWIR